MSKTVSPWTKGAGFERLVANENVVSDLLQFLTLRDPLPWRSHVGFEPIAAQREVVGSNRADLVLTSASGVDAVLEIKVGHFLDVKQQRSYEKLPPSCDLYLLGLEADRRRVSRQMQSRWKYRSLADVVLGWQGSVDPLASLLAREAGSILKAWDEVIIKTFLPTSDPHAKTLSEVNQKFLAKAISRRLAHDLADDSRWADSNPSAGGLAATQAWIPIRGGDQYRAFIAEVRWWQSKSNTTHVAGELRFGIDFTLRKGEVEDESLRRAAYEKAVEMNDEIRLAPLKKALPGTLASLLSTPKEGDRPQGQGEWAEVVISGFAKLNAARSEGEARLTRKNLSPDFFGDGATRFVAKADIDFRSATAVNVGELLQGSLDYLRAAQ